jgi:hypothetical protein
MTDGELTVKHSFRGDYHPCGMYCSLVVAAFPIPFALATWAYICRPHFIKD